ncbi:hypothetical protein AVEN_262149-1 [Araneus ventricosus]|uniref:Uncharacterized protein n=1 Tax=Araneus ventricosus TaxID=182803 RepID=A0A4Y2EJT4_ARAVE|nr:hypothetical protein AVEN_262149-1 [Araneus ventricosus]
MRKREGPSFVFRNGRAGSDHSRASSDTATDIRGHEHLIHLKWWENLAIMFDNYSILELFDHHVAKFSPKCALFRNVAEILEKCILVKVKIRSHV